MDEILLKLCKSFVPKNTIFKSVKAIELRFVWSVSVWYVFQLWLPSEYLPKVFSKRWKLEIGVPLTRSEKQFWITFLAKESERNSHINCQYSNWFENKVQKRLIRIGLYDLILIGLYSLR
jgi:hypothetical protein